MATGGAFPLTLATNGDVALGRSAVALSFAAIPLAWLAIPGEGAWTLAAGCALFSWLGASSTLLLNATQSHFLAICPDKSEQVAGSVALNLATGAGAGILGSILGPWLVTLATHWAPYLPQGTFGGPLGVFRLYFFLLVPILATAIHHALRLRSRGTLIPDEKIPSRTQLIH